MTVHHSGADSLFWLCIPASRGSRIWVSALWLPGVPDTLPAPGIAQALFTPPVLEQVFGLTQQNWYQRQYLACKWEPAGSECMHMPDGGYRVSNPLTSLPVFPPSLGAPHWAQPGGSGTVVTGCTDPTHLHWCMGGALTPTTSVPNIKYWLQPAGLGQTARCCLQKGIHGKPHCMVSTWLSLFPWHCKSPMGFSLSPPKHRC